MKNLTVCPFYVGISAKVVQDVEGKRRETGPGKISRRHFFLMEV